MTAAPSSSDRMTEAQVEGRPKTYAERQESLSRWIIRRQRQHQEKIRRRAKAFSLQKEAARNLFITGCLLFDLLVVPEPALIFGGPVGLALSGILLAAALAFEVGFYRNHFTLPPAEE